MSKYTQCTHGVGRGASGSSQTSAKLFVPAGTSDQDSAGERSAWSRAFLSGTGLPSAKAELCSFMAGSSVYFLAGSPLGTPIERQRFLFSSHSFSARFRLTAAASARRSSSFGEGASDSG